MYFNLQYSIRSEQHRNKNRDFSYSTNKRREELKRNQTNLLFQDIYRSMCDHKKRIESRF